MIQKMLISIRVGWVSGVGVGVGAGSCEEITVYK